MWDKKYPPVAPRTHFLRFFRFRHIDPPSGVSVRHEPGSRVRKECTARRHTQKGQITHTQDNDGSHTSHGVSLYIMSWRAHGQLVLPLVWRSRPPQPLIPPRQASRNLPYPNITSGEGSGWGRTQVCQSQGVLSRHQPRRAQPTSRRAQPTNLVRAQRSWAGCQQSSFGTFVPLPLCFGCNPSRPPWRTLRDQMAAGQR